MHPPTANHVLAVSEIVLLTEANVLHDLKKTTDMKGCRRKGEKGKETLEELQRHFSSKRADQYHVKTLGVFESMWEK